MKKRLLFSICLFVCFSISLNAQNWNQVLKTVETDRTMNDYFGCSVSISGDYAIVGAYNEDKDEAGLNTLTNPGAAYILQNVAGTWTLVQKIVASDRGGNDFFGTSVSIDGDFAVVGAYQEDHDEVGSNTRVNAGSAYIFQNIAGVWTEVQKIVASDRSTDDFFGFSVAIDGDYIIVGAYQEDENAAGGATIFNPGSAYIFKNLVGTWTEMQKIVPSDRGAADFFGYTVDINGSYAIIGAYAEDENAAGGATMLESGSAYIFKNTADVWSQDQKLVASDRDVDDYFGYSVAITDSYAIVGAYQEDENEAGSSTMGEAGSAYIFENNAGSWSEKQKIVSSDRAATDNFGFSVAIDGEYAVVGARLEDEDASSSNTISNSGSVYIYNLSGATWTEEQKIVSADRGNSDSFGKATAVDGNYILVGVPQEDHDATGGGTTISGAGSAYVFYNAPEIHIREGLTSIASGGSHDFGTIVFGNSSSAISFTIENNGADDLILSGVPKVEISGTNAADFSINQSSVSSPVSPGSSTSFTITYTPSSIGAHTAEISILNNDPDETPYTITLNGTGGLQAQTISNFNPIPVKIYGDAGFLVSATASSGLDVVFTSSDPTVATCTGTNGTTITILKAGSCDILANQAGDASYDPAPQVIQTLTINSKPITVTADPQSKTYGDLDPSLTYTTNVALVSGDSFTGTLSRLAGETASTAYEIQQGSLDLGVNYIITYNIDYLTILQKPITVTADAGQNKEYGQSDPASYTYSLSTPLIGGDTFTGALSRVAGENAGFYEIQQGSLALSTNYILSYVSDNFEVTPRPITVTANSGLSKIYGTTDPPSFPYSITGTIEGGDSFTGELAREVGEDVGAYEIQQGSLSLSPNYSINYIPADYTITQKPITLTIQPMQSKQYGDPDPIYAYNLMGTLVGGDDFTGTMSREPGEDLGSYAIQQGTYTLGPNYDLIFIGDDFDITIRLIILTVDAGQSKLYGDTDPAFTYTLSQPLAFSDAFSGSMTRDFGEICGTYAIQQGSLSLSSNYFLMFTGANFTINQKPITVTADPGQTKEYGDSDPASYTYTTSTALAIGDNFSGNLSRVAGEDIGTYAIIQNNLSLNPNYILSYVGDDFEITRIDITVVADAGQTKAYGEIDPTLTYTTIGSLIGGDSFTGELTRASGEDLGIYAIEQGSLSLNSNYNLNFTSDDFEITTRPITVTVDADQTKVFGEVDPTLTYTLTGSLVGGDSFSGAISRDAGEDAGTYAIGQGTLALTTNYDLNFVGNNFEITQKEIIVDVDPNQTKVYGEVDPTLTYSVTGSLEGTDAFTGDISRIAGENFGLYEIQQSSLALTSNYNLIYNSQNFEITRKPLPITVDPNQTKVYGEADPTLTYSYVGDIIIGDEFIGELSREAGEDVGLYIIDQGTLNISLNYDISFFGDNFEITKAYPVITWNNPADIYSDTELSEIQLNAVANTAGSFVYDPILGTILPVGDNQALNVEFTPTDNLNYFNTDATVYVNVLLGSSALTNVESFISIYPNPTLGLVNLDFGDNFAKNIKITDITGKVIHEQYNLNSFETIDLSNQPSGLYFISFEAEGQTYSTRIVKR